MSIFWLLLYITITFCLSGAAALVLAHRLGRRKGIKEGKQWAYQAGYHLALSQSTSREDTGKFLALIDAGNCVVEGEADSRWLRRDGEVDALLNSLYLTAEPAALKGIARGKLCRAIVLVLETPSTQKGTTA